MAYVRFNNEGYDYYENNKILFSADNSHIHLFDYVAKDLSCLPKLFEQYVSLRMDTTNFKLRKQPNNADDFNAIKVSLIAAHPYYKHEYEKVILNAIGDYFNQLLTYSICEIHSLTFDCPLSTDWYYPRLHSLIPSPIAIGKNYPDGLSLSDFYAKWQNLINHKFTCEDDLAETFCLNISPTIPSAFTKEIHIQNWTHDLLYFMLDGSAKYMEGLSTFQRVWLYGNIFPESELISGITRKLLFHPPALYSEKDCCEENGHYCNKAIDYNDKMRDMFHPFLATSPLHARDDIPEGLMAPFKSAIEYAKTNKVGKFYEVYEINELQELLYLEITSMIQSEIIIKKCENCGKYFIRNDRKKKYCDRTASGTTCAKEAKRKQNKQRKENDPTSKLYWNEYSKNYERVKSGALSPNQFEAWHKVANEKKKQVISGEIDISIFKDWLNKYETINKIKRLKPQ